MPGTCVVAEADPFIARLLQRFASECGLQSVRADSGESLLALIRELHPAVIILEPELPGQIRGWQAANTLAADPNLCHIPIINCSWQSGAVLPDEHGCHPAAYLQKPDLHYEDFVAALAEAGIKGGS